MSDSEAETALVEFARSLVGELANGRLLELALAAQPSDHSDAGRRLASARWKRDSVGGRPVKGVLTHPDSPTLLYDLGEGHFAEGMQGKVGPVLHSDQFSSAALASKGWAPPAEPAEPVTAGKQGTSSGEASPEGRGDRPPSGSPAGPRTSPASRALEAQQAEDAISKEMQSGGATSESGTLDGHGQVWHPDRASEHNEIVRKHLEDATAIPGEGKATLLAGLGKGKPAALAKAGAFDPERHAVVSPELIMQELEKAGLVPEVRGLSPEQSAPLAHEEAAHVASLVASALAARRKNIVLDGSGTNPDADLERVQRLRSSGYTDVRGIHVHTPVEKAVDRNRGKVPPQAMRSAALSHGDDAASQGFDQLKQHLDGWEHWDHSGAAPTRKAKGGKPPKQGVGSIEDVLAGRG